MKPIKNKLCKLPSSLVVAVLVISLFAAEIDYANATGAASFPQDTTVALDVGNFTITAGSDADSVTTSNIQVTVGISSGQTFTLNSSNRYLLTNDSGYTYECLSDRSTITITSTTTKTVIITPSTNTCGTNTGGGNSGGGGGGTTSSSTPTPTPSVSVSPTPLTSFTPVPVVSVVKLYKKANDPKVYVQQSDGTLTWIKTLQDFNAAGYKWSDIKLISGSEFAKLNKLKTGGKIKIVKGLKWLNVRALASTRGKIVGKILPNEVYDFSSVNNGWYKILKNGKDFGWVFGTYVVKL